MQSVARNLAGLGRLPDREARAASAPEHVRPDALVVGAGASGRAAAAAIRQAGYTCLLLDRLDAAGLHQQVAESPGTRLQTAVFGAYADDGVWAATGLGESGEARLLTVSPRHVVIATGARIPMLPVPNNDVPGVLAARGLIALLERSGATLVGPCVVIGEGEPASTAAAKLGAACVAPGAVETILGSTRVSGVKTRDGTIDCTVVALAPTPSPASELARQAGAHVHWDGSGFAVVRDEHGRCTSADAAGLWACGEVCGPMSRAEAAHDGRRVGEAVGEVLGARRGPA
jgi:sarcosine oxidase subunit alpha